MKYIFKSSKEIFITYILNYFLIFMIALIYSLLGYKNLTNFLSTTASYILLSFNILTIIYLYKKNQQQEQSLSPKNYYPLILLGISISVLLNMIIFFFNPPHTIIKPTILTIISSGLIGPIYEETLFRYILYNRLKKKYSIKKSILITTIIFALIHLSTIKIIYAFTLGLIINMSYEKYHNILSPILIHIAANTIVLFLYEYNTYIFLLSIIAFLISIVQILPFKLNFKKTLVKKSN